MPSTSRYIQLNDFLLLEYIYTDVALPEEYSTSGATGLLLLENGYTSENSIFNTDTSEETQNTRDHSAVKTGDNKWVTLDIDGPISYLDVDSNLTNTVDLPVTFSPNYDIGYDTIRVHVVQGYNFDEVDGHILNVHYLERNGTKLNVANIVMLKNDNWYTLNHTALQFGERFYSRYYEFKIPSLYISIDNEKTFPTNLNLWSRQCSTDGKGLNYNTNVRFNLFEITNTRVVNGFLEFLTGEVVETQINTFDEFSLFAANIEESEGNQGDFFRYYATWDGAFIEDQLYKLNANGGDYTLINQIRVIEQIGPNFVQTYDLTEMQTDGFGEAKYFRPVVLSADAFSFSVEYICRLYNRVDGSQVSRIASVTSYNTQKWGKQLLKLNLTNPFVDNIYNRVESGIQFNLPDVDFEKSTETVYVPTFFERGNLLLAKSNMFINPNGEPVSTKTDATSIYWGFGKCPILINPYDNHVKFSIYQKGNTGGVIPLDISYNGTSYELSFIGDSGAKEYVKSTSNPKAANPSNGELYFVIPANIATKVLNFNNKVFNIITRNADGVESIVYSGVFYSYINIDAFNEYETQNILSSEDYIKKEETLRTLETKLTQPKINVAVQVPGKPDTNSKNLSQILKPRSVTNVDLTGGTSIDSGNPPASTNTRNSNI